MTSSPSEQSDVSAALGLLRDSIAEEVQRIRNEGGKAVEVGDYDTAHSVIDFAKRLEGFEMKVKGLVSEWDALEDLRDEATPEVQAIVSKRFFGRRHVGETTPDRAFCPYILQVLQEMGGKGRAKAVKSAVEKKMKHILKPADYEQLNSPDKPIRWVANCGWARKIMVGEEDGRLVYGKNGIWEISEKGRDWLKTHTNR